MNIQQELENRMSKVREQMHEHGLDTLLVYDSGRHNFLRMNYVAYLTDFINLGPETILLLSRSDVPSLFLSPAWDVARAQDETTLADIRPFSDLWARLSKGLGKTGLVGRDAMHSGLHQEITNALNQTPIDAKDILEKMARCKSPLELERLRRAAAIADAGVSALHDEGRPGLKEYELAAIVEHRMRYLGAEDNFGMVVANSHNQALHPPTDRLVQPDDLVISEITPCIGGLFVQICRTMVLGEPSPVLRDKYAILKEAMTLGMNAASTGSPASAIAEAINSAFIDAGYAQYCRPPFMRVRGHGLGCGSSAPGSLEDGNQTRLETGMTFIIHPNQYLPETGYLTLGDTVVMTETRAQTLMQSSWDLYIKE